MIFGKADISSVPEKYSEYITHNFNETTGVDQAANYILGLTMILSFIVSLVLNPTVFYFNYQQPNKMKITRVLFMMLAVSDFLTNIYQPLYVARNLLTTEVLPLIRIGTRYEQAQTMMLMACGYSSMITTVLISVCRFIKVKYPFYEIRGKLVLAGYAVAELVFIAWYTLLVVGYADANERYENDQVLWFLYCQRAYSFDPVIYDPPIFITQSALQILLCGVGLISSALTVVTLMSREEVASTNSSAIAKSSRAIMVMNIGNMVASVIIVIYGYYGMALPFINVLGACGLFMILSALNPLARVYFSSEIKDMVRKKVKKMRGNDVFPAGITAKTTTTKLH